MFQEVTLGKGENLSFVQEIIGDPAVQASKYGTHDACLTEKVRAQCWVLGAVR